jgi:hypothetical protein
MKNPFTILLYSILLLTVTFNGCQQLETSQDNNQAKDPLILERSDRATDTKNVIFVLSDDHRYDFMGFTGKVPWLKTPAMDKMAAEGCHLENAFVTTSLCSPSRASILTGMYSHAHTVVDNQAPVPENLIFFPQYLQKAGYERVMEMIIPGRDSITGKVSKDRGIIISPV